MISVQRHLELAGRVLLAGVRFAPAAVAGTALLSLSKGGAERLLVQIQSQVGKMSRENILEGAHEQAAVSAV